MVVKISFFLSILFGVVSIYSPNNFEGVITYKRVSQTGNIAFEKYYLKNNKLKIESEFHTDGKLTLHESYFDFKNNPNQVFKIKNDNYQWVDLKESVIDSVVSTGVQEVVCGQSTEKYIIYHAPILNFDSEVYTTQEIWVSSDHSFEIPKTWMTSPYMLNLFNPGITLKMIESGSHDTYGFGYSYSREMIDISPMTLDDLIFDLPK